MTAGARVCSGRLTRAVLFTSFIAMRGGSAAPDSVPVSVRGCHPVLQYIIGSLYYRNYLYKASPAGVDGGPRGCVGAIFSREKTPRLRSEDCRRGVGSDTEVL